MTQPNRQKLKSVLAQVPPGFLVDSKWLTAHNIAKSSASDYHSSGWLERVARGVYRRPSAHAGESERVDWKVVLLSAQRIMNYDFHVGGTTALALDGHTHYLGFGRDAVAVLYGTVPNWLPKLRSDAHFFKRSRQLFGTDRYGIDNLDFDPAAPNAPNPWNSPLISSSAERAILETLNELPEKESFHTVDMLFEGLSTLRPGPLTRLLQGCTSVKVRRLFFLFADRHNHRWLAHVEREKIDLGSGPRSLAKEGCYLPAYQLVVPEEFARTRDKDATDA